LDIYIVFGALKRFIPALALGLIVLFCLHSLWVGWPLAFALALLPVVLGTAGVGLRSTFVVAGALLIAVYVQASFFSDDRISGKPTVATALEQRTEGAIETWAPHVGAMADAATSAFNRVAAKAVDAALPVPPAVAPVLPTTKHVSH
jgi:hypothetical protein